MDRRRSFLAVMAGLLSAAVTPAVAAPPDEKLLQDVQYGPPPGYRRRRRRCWIERVRVRRRDRFGRIRVVIREREVCR